MNVVFRMKMHHQGRERVLAVCDEELVGQRFEEGKLRLHVMPEFYDGFRGDANVFEVELRRSTVANLVGERAVQLAIDLGFVAEGNVLRIGGVPHAQWALML